MESTGRIYHHYELWEDYRYGFYNNCSVKDKKKYIDGIIEMFNDKVKTEKYMNLVVSEWPNSCEHNLTNPSMNQIAYIGQGACCLYCGAPSIVTMEGWNKLSPSVQDTANMIAKDVINKWNNRTTVQLKLNFNG